MKTSKKKPHIDVKKYVRKLHRYIQHGRIKKLKKTFQRFEESNLLDVFRKELDKLDGGGKNYLHKFASEGEGTMLKTLLDLGADIKTCDTHGSNFLHYSLNYVLASFDRAFLGNFVFDFLTICTKALLTKRNDYGETPQDLLEEVLLQLENLQRLYLQEDEESDTECEDLWTEKLFFEMTEDDKLGNENYAQDEHEDTDKFKKESFSEWGDRIRTEFHGKRKVPQNEACHHPRKRKNTKKDDSSSRKLNSGDMSRNFEALRLKIRIYEWREGYETSCKEFFSCTDPERVFRYGDIPWPDTDGKCSVPEGDPSDTVSIMTYGFTKDEKIKYLRKQRVRWHPDRFSQKCGNRLLDDDRERILAAVNELSQNLNSALEQLQHDA